MKKVLIITLYGNSNFGNKLQNYALQEKIKSLGFAVETLVYKHISKSKLKNIKNFIARTIKNLIRDNEDALKEKMFLQFSSEYLKIKVGSSTYYKIDKKVKNNYDYYVYGSDQIWNPYYSGNTPLFMGELTDKNKNIAYAASFGISELPAEFKDIYIKGFNNFKNISVREIEGKEIVDKLIGKDAAEVLIDPTMLLMRETWEKVIKKPENFKSKKYILNCYLGELSVERKKVIEDFAKKNNCDIINVFDKESQFYNIGPSEFLYLEKNAYLICTDSFHSCVFSILFDRPFVVFERESKTLKDMYSRIDNLLNKFELKNRKFNGKEITKDNLNHDYSKAYKILEDERKKSDKFLRNALEIEEDK